MSETTVSRSAMAAILGMHWLCAYIYVGVLFICIPASGYAYQLLPHSKQAEARDPAGKITVEASVIQVVVCNGPGENGGQFYIYQYVNRPGFRAIKPPNWGQPLGGSDYPSREQAAAVACGGGSLPPGGGSPWAGQWRLTWGASTATLTLAVTGSTAQGQYDLPGWAGCRPDQWEHPFWHLEQCGQWG